MVILKNKELRQRILQTSLPAIGEMVLYMVIGVVDIAVVGRLGAAPLAAVGLGAELFFSVILFLEALGMGSSVLIAQSKGAGKMKYAARVAGQTFTMALIIGFITAFAGLKYGGDLLGLFAVEADVYQQALNYITITFWISPLALAYCMTNAIFRGLGRTDIPLKIAVITNIINCAGDVVLVYGLLGFPAMGVAGAALATSVAHVIGFFISAAVLLGGWSEIRVDFRCLYAIYLPAVRDIFRLGLPSLAEQFFHTMAYLTSAYLIVYMGTMAFASHQVALTIESISFMPGMGVAIAATALVGQAVGARNREDALMVSRASIELILFIMGILGIIFALFPHFIAGLFTNDREIITTTAVLIRIAALEQLTIAASMVLGGILKGSGDTRTPFLIMTSFTWLFRLPLMYLFIRILHFPISYLWGLFVVDWALRTIVFAAVYRHRDLMKHRAEAV